MTNSTCFTPTVLYAEAGTPITWTNETAETHDVAGATVEWGNYDDITPGQTVSYRFDKPGTYVYYCFLHPGMVGAVVIGDGRVALNDVGSAAAGGVTRATDAKLAASKEPAGPSGRQVANGVNASGSDDEEIAAALGALAGAVGVGAVVAGWRLRKR
jgi:hypothetical protein